MKSKCETWRYTVQNTSGYPKNPECKENPFMRLNPGMTFFNDELKQ